MIDYFKYLFVRLTPQILQTDLKIRPGKGPLKNREKISD